MQLSEFFALDIDRVHVISFTSALLIASLIRYGFVVVPSFIIALFCHYIFVSQRPLMVAAIFSVFLPLSNYLLVYFYKKITQKINNDDYMLRAAGYTVIIGLLLPLYNSLSMMLVAQLLGYPFMARENFLAYSVLAGAISQLLLTPFIYILLGFTNKKDRKNYLHLDKLMRKEAQNNYIHSIWRLICFGLLLSAILTNNPMTINTLVLLIVPIIALGVGRFGIIEPYLITITGCLLAAYNAVSTFNSELITEHTFYNIVTILFSKVTLILLLTVQAIKNHLTLEKTIHAERLDPYTNLLSISQFKSDAPLYDQHIVLFLDINDMVNSLKALGFEGKTQLIKQLTKFMSLLLKNKGMAYLPPFSQGVLYLFSKKEISSLEIQHLVDSLSSFKFSWKHQTFNLIHHKIICGQLDTTLDINTTLSNLCTPSEQYSYGKDINWINFDDDEDHKLNKLSNIQNAFKLNKFTLVCQPYLNLTDENTPAYFEVLIRLPQDKHANNDLTPAAFFPLINEFGLEVELDKWVIEHTFLTLKEHVLDWSNVGRCSINLTAQALNSQSIAAYIDSLAQQYTIPLDKICFEITESSAIYNEKMAVDTIQELRECGCKIALDDFGTGYASFDYLRRLPLDILKIDGSFVRNIITNTVDQTIVKSISQVAQDMKLITVAEFVESEAHIPVLQQLNINYAQGYAIAKPTNLAEYLKQINK